MPPPMTIAWRHGGHRPPSLAAARSGDARASRGREPAPASVQELGAGVRAQRRRELGEQSVRERDGAARRLGAAAGAPARATARSASMSSRMAIFSASVKRARVDAGKVAAAEAVEVGGEVAQEVDLLEGRAEGRAPSSSTARSSSRTVVSGEEGAQAHQPDDLGRSVDVGVELAGVVLGLVEVACASTRRTGRSARRRCRSRGP